MSNNYDAILIGAGPAGSSAATILAEKGHNVLLIEREKFPRYHVGESLLPFTFEPLKRLGLIDDMRSSSFTKKYSVQFISTSGEASQPFYFNSRYEDDVAQTWQVLRSEFDHMLLNTALSKGANVLEETQVLDLLREGERVTGVRVRTPDGNEVEYNAPITLDCTGKESFSSSRNRWRMRDPYLNKVAVWTYYKGAKRDTGIDEGATTVAYLPDKGWFWYIPLSGDMVSVGIVAERDYLFNGSTKDHAEIFQREVQNNEWIKEHLAEGEQTGEYRITGEYSYRNKFCSIDGLVLAGDALGFLDPVFSSGVFLALKSGVMLADEIDQVMKKGQPIKSSSFENYGKRMQSSIETMRKIVYAFYDKEFSFGDLVKRGDHLRSALTDCLVGNVDDKDFRELFDAMSDLAELPEPVEHGLAHASS